MDVEVASSCESGSVSTVTPEDLKAVSKQRESGSADDKDGAHAEEKDDAHAEEKDGADAEDKDGADAEEKDGADAEKEDGAGAENTDGADDDDDVLTDDDDDSVEEEEVVPICTKCGLCKFKHLQLCKCCGCGTVIVNEDLDDISEHSVYTSEDSDIQSWVAVNRKPKLPAESEDYDGDEETMGPGSPSGSVVMQVITPREYVPQDVAAEVERKRIEQEETEKRLEVEKQMRELHLKKMMEDDLKSLTDDDKRDRRIGERLDGLVRREALAKEIALEKKKKKEEQEKIERARLLKLMEAHKVKAPLAESVTDRPLIKEEDNANCADNEDSSTEDDGEADLDDDEKAERAELKRPKRQRKS